jgi:hypothetical protein
LLKNLSSLRELQRPVLELMRQALLVLELLVLELELELLVRCWQHYL